MKKKKFGFTMAEVLIAIAIIGAIAALVLPVMMKNYNNRIFATKARRAYTAVVDACSHGLSDDQVKYPGDIINSYCEYIPGKSCTTGENGSITLKDGTVLTLTGWGNIPGGDLDVTIDTNGSKKPDEKGKDIWTTKLTRDCKFADNNSYGTISYLKAHDWKISDDTEDERLAKRRDFSKWKSETITEGLTKSECDAVKDSLGIKTCYYEDDRWAAAVQKCGGIQNLPNDQDLYALAKEIYGSENCNDEKLKCTGAPDITKIPEGLSGLGYLWSSDAQAWNGAHNRIFSKNGSSIGDYAWHRNASNPKVVCLGDLK